MNSFDTQQQCEEYYAESEFLGALAESEADIPYPHSFGDEYWMRVD
jgi:hypothetical protein